VSIKSTPPPATSVDIAAVPTKFFINFDNTVKQYSVHFIAKFEVLLKYISK